MKMLTVGIRLSFTMLAMSLLFIGLAGCPSASGLAPSPTASPNDQQPSPSPVSGERALSAGIICLPSTFVGQELEAEALAGEASVAYHWSLERPVDSTAELSQIQGSRTSFITDRPGRFTLVLSPEVPGRSSEISRAGVLVFPAWSAQLYVRSGAGGSPNGSQSQPYPSIQSALAAAPDGCNIHIAAGSYEENIIMPTDRSISLRGGYSSDTFDTRDPSSYQSIIQGVSTSPVVSIVYQGDENHNLMLSIDGMVMRGGNRGVFAQNEGNGGMLVVELVNNVIEDNGDLSDEGAFGGGICLEGAIAILRGNRIANNRAGRGGGFSIVTHELEYQLLVEGNQVLDHQISGDHGAGAYIQAYRGLILDNEFSGNRINKEWGWGGGLIIDGNRYSGFNESTFILLRGNRYIENYAPSIGTGLFIDEGANARLYNELLYGNYNSDESRSGPLYIDGETGSSVARTEARNCTIANNPALDYGEGAAIVVEGGSVLELKDSILWGNGEDVQEASEFSVSGTSSLIIANSIHAQPESDISGLRFIDCLVADPLFIDPALGDFHLRSQGGHYAAGIWIQDSQHSPGVDAGELKSAFSLEPQPNGGRVNLGAYGNSPQASKSR